MARTILEAVLTDALEVCPWPPWLAQSLQCVEVLVQVQCLLDALALAESVSRLTAAPVVLEVYVTRGEVRRLLAGLLGNT